MDRFDTYLASIPKLHSWDGGKTWVTGGFQARELRFLQECMRSFREGARVIETGAGNSTIAFLYGNPRELVSIAPEQELFGRIRDYCGANGVSTERWNATLGRSEERLPPLAAEGRTFDVALIDGGHAWPTVFVDFCYLNATLRAGGLLIVDDVDLFSVGELVALLREGAQHFEQVAVLRKTICFRKLVDLRYMPEWTEHPYLVHRTREKRGEV